MASYKIVFKPSVSKDLKKIPKNDVQRILSAIRTLANDPRPPQSKKLSGQEVYRLRQGNYRIIYSIEDGQLIISIVRVRHRRDAYR
jgi:mRNA interferase RelE/StbE